MHVNEIAMSASEMQFISEGEIDDFAAKLSSSLSQNIKSKSPTFRKVSNGAGGYKRGIYGLKIVRKSKLKPSKENVFVESIETTSTQFTGKGGEYAVMSELLFRGYNCSVMTVDDGIDLVAEKKNSYFHIQVKTTSSNEGGAYSFKVKRTSYSNHESHRTFYIFVIRRLLNNRNMCDYVILPYAVFNSFILRGSVADKDYLSVRIKLDENGHFFLNKKEDVSAHVNHFGIIA